MTISALIIDDETLARRKLKQMLVDEPDILVVGECGTAGAAVEILKRDPPDLVFLDIELRGTTAFEVIRQVGVDHMPAIIFVTGYDQYAIQAFEANAVDYLMKPFDRGRFKAALARAVRRITERKSGAKATEIIRLLADLQTGQRTAEAVSPGAAAATGQPAIESGWLLVRGTDRSIRFLPVGEIHWVEAAGNYVVIHVGTARYIHRSTIRELETQLGANQFARIHRSTLVNLRYIDRMEPYIAGDYTIRLKDQTTLKLSRTYRAAFEARVGRIA